MTSSRPRRNTHAARARALYRSTGAADAAARRRLSGEAARTPPARVVPPPAPTEADPCARPVGRWHTVVVKVPAGERRSFSDAVRSVLACGRTPHEAAATITGAAGTGALGARPGRIAPMAVLSGKVAVLDERSVLGADVDSERWVFCPRCARRARYRGRTERLASPDGLWVGDAALLDVVFVPCRMCSPRR